MATPSSFIPDEVPVPSSFVADAEPIPGTEKLGGLPPIATPKVPMQEVSRIAPIVEPIKQVATSHAIQSLGGPTASELYDKAFPPVQGPGFMRQASEFSRRMVRTVPEAVDFALTPMGAAAIAAPIVLPHPAVRAGIGAAFSTDMAKGTVEAGKEFVANPSGGTAADVLKSAAFTALPFVHAASTARKASKIGKQIEAGKEQAKEFQAEEQRLQAEEQAAQLASQTDTTPAPKGPKSAQESAAVFEQAYPKPEKSAAESAEVFKAQEQEVGKQAIDDILSERETGRTALEQAVEAQPEVPSVRSGHPSLRFKQTEKVEPNAPENRVEPEIAPERVAETGVAPVAGEAETAGAVEPVRAEVGEAPNQPSVTELPISEILADPVRFQYKRDTGAGGAGEELRSVQTWDPDLGGVVAVWRDPANGKTYVVNGHNRLALANRLGVDRLAVRFLTAKDATEARIKGALINIAEGRGTAVDAAKLFRDAGLTPSDLETRGLSMRGERARQGVALANLSEPIFRRVVDGEIPVDRASLIGERLPKPEDQEALVTVLDDMESSGKPITNQTLAELIDLAKGAAKDVTEEVNLFGTEQIVRNMLPEMADLSGKIRKRLSQERRLFSAVGTASAAKRLGDKGNVIKAEKNAEIANQVSQAQELYDRLAYSSGPINEALKLGAKELAEGGKQHEVLERTYERVREAVAGLIGGSERPTPQRPVATPAGGGHPAASGLRGETDIFGRSAEEVASENARANDQYANSLTRDQLTAEFASEKNQGQPPLESSPLFTGDIEPKGQMGLLGHPAARMGAKASPEEVAAATQRITARAKQFVTEEKGEQSFALSTQDLADLATVGRDLLSRGAHRVEAWKQQMVETFGEWVREHLDDVWATVQQVKRAASPTFTRKGDSGPGFLVRATGDLIDLEEGARHYNMVRDLNGELRKGAIRGRGNGIEYASEEVNPASLRLAVKRVAERYPEVYVDGPRGSMVYDSADLARNGYRLAGTQGRRVSRGMFGDERGAFSLKPLGPKTPSEVYAKEMVAKREAAREGPISGFAKKLRETVQRLKSETVDSTAAMVDLLRSAEQTHGFKVKPADDISHQIDRVYRAPSMAAQFAEDNGLVKAIREVDDLDYFEQYLIGKQVLAVEAAGFKTGRNLADVTRLVKDFEPRYKAQEPYVRNFTSKLLDYSVESGLISKELANKLAMIYPDYVPINRVFNAIEKGDLDISGGARAVASLSKQTIVQKLMGSEREIENPLASLLKKTQDAFAQGERNKAGRMLAGYANLPGIKGLIVETKAGASVPGHMTFSFLDNGVKRTFQTTPEIAAAAKSLEVHSLGVLGRILAAPGRLMKAGTTGINLPFVASNVMSDQVFTAVTSRYDRSLANPVAFGKALMAALKHDKVWEEIVREGAGFTSFDMMRNQPQLSLAKIRAGKSAEARAQYIVSHPVASIGDFWRAVEDVVGKSEEVGRARLYTMTKERMLKEGRTAQDARILAAQEANNALPNYYRAGNIIRPLNAAIPYLNASIQGSRSFLAAMQKNPTLTSAKVAAGLFFPVAMATLWNLSSDDRRKVYEDIQDYEKDNNMIFVLPGSKKDKQNRYDVVKIKLPPGLNRLTVPVRRLIEQWHGMEPLKVQEVAESLFGAVSPVEPNMRSVASQMIPQAVKPTAQAIANYDYFRGRAKVPGSLQNRPTELQTYSYTSGTARAIAKRIGVSPIKVEEFIKDTMGGIGAQVLNASDNTLAKLGLIPPDQVGGTSTASAVAARFSKARSGEIESKKFDKEKEIATKVMSETVSHMSPEALREMVRLRVGFSAPEIKEGMTPEEYAMSIRIRGRMMDAKLREYMAIDGFADLPDTVKTAALKEAVRAGQQEAAELFTGDDYEEYKQLPPEQRVNVLKAYLVKVSQ